MSSTVSPPVAFLPLSGGGMAMGRKGLEEGNLGESMVKDTLLCPGDCVTQWVLVTVSRQMPVKL